MKRLDFIKRMNGRHWVGDGFPVRNVFSYTDIAERISPFLMLDYAGPHDFEPTTQRRGVGQHPHRGFETVTVVFEGEVEHRDSSGGGGTIGPGDVQWMTAGAGIVHQEFHAPAYASRGGPFRMAQLWVDLPRAKKMTRPGYQGIVEADIPTLELDGGATLRVVAGDYAGRRGPAHTHSPINLWDVQIPEGASITLNVPEGHTAVVVPLRGALRSADGQVLQEAEAGVFETAGTQLALHAEGAGGAQFLFMGGEPLRQAVVGYGPFVMSSEDEIRQAPRRDHHDEQGERRR